MECTPFPSSNRADRCANLRGPLLRCQGIVSHRCLNQPWRARSAAEPPDEVRVGIDLGEVVVEGGRVYGDCVNIAARVQQVAPPGGIYLAGTAYDHLGVALPLRFEYMGERAVRSIDKPQRLYRVE